MILGELCTSTISEAAMMYADVGGEKRTAEPGLTGFCPCCNYPTIPKCGREVVWHWAHKTGGECDSWSEPMGPWHLGWQALVQQEYAEVTKAPHRADIVGNAGTVVELQHSSISATEIEERENFYGNMIWLFDATSRFGAFETGDQAFLNLGRNKHLARCSKPVFLDFGDSVVQLDRFTNLFPDYVAVGTVRDRAWFVANFLSEVARPGAKPPEWSLDDTVNAVKHRPECKHRWTKHPTIWIDPATGEKKTYRKGENYLSANAVWRSTKKPVYEDIIQQFPALAFGWTVQSLRSMLELLSGTPIIFDGRFRILPVAADMLRVHATVSATRSLLEELEGHIRAGRIPVLKDETKQRILKRAEDYEVERYGKPLEQTKAQSKPKHETPSLFD